MNEAPARPAGAREKSAPRAWQRMLSGRRLDLLDPSPLDIEIEDIAHGLARVARWNGQTRGEHIFSVAQHSVLVAHIAERDNVLSRKGALYALLHDAPEYVIGDMISPFKSVLGDGYKGVEARLLTAILLRFGLPPKPAAALTRRVKQADIQAAFFEATELAGFSLAEARKLFGAPGARTREVDALLAPMSSGAAQELFLSRFRAIEQRTIEPSPAETSPAKPSAVEPSPVKSGA